VFLTIVVSKKGGDHGQKRGGGRKEERCNERGKGKREQVLVVVFEKRGVKEARGKQIIKAMA
jgi:hypothetical protein